MSSEVRQKDSAHKTFARQAGSRHRFESQRNLTLLRCSPFLFDCASENETDVQRSVSEITKLNEQKANLRSQNTQLTQDISQGKREHKTLLDTVARNVRKNHTQQ